MLLGESGLSRLWERVVRYVNEYVETYDSLAIATKRKRGQVRPDGVTITVDEDGTIHGSSAHDIASTEDAVAGVDDERLMTPLKVAQAIDARAGDAADVRLGIVTDELGNRRVAILVRRD